MKRSYLVVLLSVIVAVVMVGCGDNNPATNPDISVEFNGTSVLSGGAAPFSGAADSSSGPVTDTVSVTNLGDDVLNFTASLSGTDAGDEITLPSPPAEAVSPGNTKDFLVSLQHTGSAGSVDATLTIISNDPDEASFELNLTGYVFY